MIRSVGRLVCATVGVLAVVMAPSVARAQAPAQVGWWSATNPGGVGGLPEPPPPPDVPTNGMLIEGGAGSAPGAADASPTAYGALVYQLPLGSAASTLTLQIAPDSGTTPASTLQVCRLLNPAFAPSHGGPVAEGPQFDCARSVKAAVSADGSAFTFKVAGLAEGDALGVAVLPTSPTDRVVLSAPNAASLAVIARAPAPDSSASPGQLGRPPVNGEPGSIPQQQLPGVPSVPELSSVGGIPAVPAPLVSSAPSREATPPLAASVPLVSAAQSQTAPAPWLVAALVLAAGIAWMAWTAAGRAAARRSIPSTPSGPTA